MTQTTHPLPSPGPARRRTPRVLIVAGLIALTVVPFIAGMMRLIELASGPVVTPENARFVDSPVPVVVHIISALTFLVLGALQFVPALRRHRWHRLAGRVLVPAGIAAALSGLWMTLFYALPAINGVALYWIRIAVSTAMASFIVVAFLAIRRGDVRSHSAWMTRAYALGMGAGTQVITVPLGTAIFGQPGQALYAILMSAGWGINIVIAELVIARRAHRGLLS